MQVETNLCWNQHPQQHFITVTTRTILHPRLEANEVTDSHAITKILCTRTQAKQSISKHPICLTDSEYYYILEEIGHQ